MIYKEEVKPPIHLQKNLTLYFSIERQHMDKMYLLITMQDTFFWPFWALGGGALKRDSRHNLIESFPLFFTLLFFLFPFLLGA